MAAFYNDQPSGQLRFGDVVTGFESAALHMHSPSADNRSLDVKIQLTRPIYFAVMTPCCSIEQQTISLVPLVEVRHRFFDFPRLAEDIARINSPMPASSAFTLEHWKKLSAEEQEKVLEQNDSYIFLECFVYEPNQIFPAYELKNKKLAFEAVRHYMVDFRSIARVECAQIERKRDAPAGIKVLELSVPARGQLRDKLAYYFGRIPDEDAA